MTFDDYSHDANITKVYPLNQQIIYPIMGLGGEAGELFNKIKKILRKRKDYTPAAIASLSILEFSPGQIQEVIDELGDCLWYLNAICLDMGFTFNQIAQENLIKLQERYKLEPPIKGSIKP